MSLADDLAAQPRLKSGPPCSTCSWLEGLSEEDRNAFRDHVRQPRMNRAGLHRVISEKWGYTACESSLKYHLLYHESTPPAG